MVHSDSMGVIIPRQSWLCSWVQKSDSCSIYHAANRPRFESEHTPALRSGQRTGANADSSRQLSDYLTVTIWGSFAADRSSVACRELHARANLVVGGPTLLHPDRLFVFGPRRIILLEVSCEQVKVSFGLVCDGC